MDCFYFVGAFQFCGMGGSVRELGGGHDTARLDWMSSTADDGELSDCLRRVKLGALDGCAFLSDGEKGNGGYG